jgi:SAM-dependent methyltransferase
LYDRIRPSYPAEAVRWLIGEKPLRVVDLAAGTGIFTRLLLSLGHEVVAVEPDEAMLAVLSTRTPRVEAHVGQAESIPLPSRSADAAVAAQAHWWFDASRAYAEIARVLRPGGMFGAIWNGPDVRVPWAAEFQRIESGSPSVKASPPVLGAEFDPPEDAVFEHHVRQTSDALLEILRSRAYFITAPEDVQQRVEAEMRALVATLPHEVDFPYIAYAVRSRRQQGCPAEARGK